MKEIKFALTLPLEENSSSTITRNIYESFRMLGDSLLTAKGIQSQDHLMPIKELLKLKVNTKRPIYLIENLRRLRHNINYYGHRATIDEAKDAIDIAKNCFGPLFNEIKKFIDKINS